MKSKILQLLMSFVHGAIVIFGREAGVTSFESRGMAFFHCLLELIWEKHMYSVSLHKTTKGPHLQIEMC